MHAASKDPTYGHAWSIYDVEWATEVRLTTTWVEQCRTPYIVVPFDTRQEAPSWEEGLKPWLMRPVLAGRKKDATHKDRKRSELLRTYACAGCEQEGHSISTCQVVNLDNLWTRWAIRYGVIRAPGSRKEGLKSKMDDHGGLEAKLLNDHRSGRGKRENAKPLSEASSKSQKTGDDTGQQGTKSHFEGKLDAEHTAAEELVRAEEREEREAERRVDADPRNFFQPGEIVMLRAMEPVYVLNHQAELARVQRYKFSASIVRSLRSNQAFLDASYVLFAVLVLERERRLCVCACLDVVYRYYSVTAVV
jgi:hypothetical protein